MLGGAAGPAPGDPNAIPGDSALAVANQPGKMDSSPRGTGVMAPAPPTAANESPSSSDVSLAEPDLMSIYSKFAPTKRIIIISVASTIGLLSPLSSNLYTPAIPAVARDLHVSTDAINLTITSSTLR